jgi:2-oxo-4-hydroxy-4-carboxy-5-ureidoimidazoline decarboxylase
MQRPHSQVKHRSVAWLDHLAQEQAIAELRTCCAADAWVHAMLGRRPFGSLKPLLDTAEDTVLAMDDAALEQALAAHARIGERRTGTDREDNWSRTEQAAALAADDDITALLAEGNRAYEERFGHVFLIRAAGRSAEDMYAALQERLANDELAERSVVRHELAEIVRLRLTKLVSE